MTGWMVSSLPWHSEPRLPDHLHTQCQGCWPHSDQEYTHALCLQQAVHKYCQSQVYVSPKFQIQVTNPSPKRKRKGSVTGADTMSYISPQDNCIPKLWQQSHNLQPYRHNIPEHDHNNISKCIDGYTWLFFTLPTSVYFTPRVLSHHQ